MFFYAIGIKFKFNFLFYKDDKIPICIKTIEESVETLIQNKASMAIRPHPFLNGNLLYEFGEAMLQPRYKSQMKNIVTYITEELKNGLNFECQMYATGTILRNMQHSETVKINNIWWEHINRCGIECQISFNVIAQKFNSIILLPHKLD